MKSLLIFGCVLFLGPAALAQNASHGEAEYKLCAGCHGFRGEGNALVSAPALAGLQDWYLERQLDNYRAGIRGAGEDTTAGQTMGTMALALTSDTEVRDVVAYIAGLPEPGPTRSLGGDASRGEALYTACAACHGAAAEGNAALNAPALATMSDWYLVSQLQAYKTGTRGTHADDTWGRQMRPMAATLVDDQAMRDVAAYITSLD